MNDEVIGTVKVTEGEGGAQPNRTKFNKDIRIHEFVLAHISPRVTEIEYLRITFYSHVSL